MPYSKRKIDLNQNRIVEELRSLGYSVALTHELGRGFPDIVVGKFGFNMLVELKSKGGKLTIDEETFFNNWSGQVCVATSAAQVIRYFKTIFSNFNIAIADSCDRELEQLDGITKTNS